MATIKEVAKQAGVSYATVSHVINNTRFVSEDTRERVLSAMSALNYQHNDLARSLRSGKTHIIGLILPDSANPFYAEIGRSIEDAAYQLGYSLILCNTEQDTHREVAYIDVLAKKQIDGFIFAAGDHTTSISFLHSLQIPFVLINRELPQVEVDTVLTDNRQGGYLATRHLIEMGHRRIACIAGPYSPFPSANRLTGYRDALLQAGIPYDDGLVLHGDYHPESGFCHTQSLLKQPKAPTAIFAWNDLMAVGVLRAASAAGIRVPQDLAVVGYDDIELARYTDPPLTTVAQPFKTIGALVTQLLAQRIKDRSCPIQHVILPTQLIVRQSTVG